MKANTDVIYRDDLLDEIDRIYNEHYVNTYDKAVHDIFNAVKRRIRRCYPEAVISFKKHKELKNNYSRLLETANTLDTALREYQSKYEEAPATGKWEYYSTTMMECSVCGRHVARHRFKFCPHCGAKMLHDRRTSNDQV